MLFSLVLQSQLNLRKKNIELHWLRRRRVCQILVLIFLNNFYSVKHNQFLLDNGKSR